MNALTATRLTLACFCLVALSACSGGSAAEPVQGSTSASAKPSSTPTPRGPTKKEDLAKAKKALLTTAELGKPWFQPKAVSTSGGKKTEACPGQPNEITLAPPVARAWVGFTEGKQRGASIGSFTVSTLPEDGGAEKYREAWAQVIKSCAEYRDASKLYVVTTQEGPRTVPGADEVMSRVDRVYYDKKHARLAYARHFVGARTGRVFSGVEYDFLVTKSDPKAKNFDPATALLTQQLAKTKATFGD